MIALDLGFINGIVLMISIMSIFIVLISVTLIFLIAKTGFLDSLVNITTFAIAVFVIYMITTITKDMRESLSGTIYVELPVAVATDANPNFFIDLHKKEDVIRSLIGKEEIEKGILYEKVSNQPVIER